MVYGNRAIVINWYWGAIVKLIIFNARVEVLVKRQISAGARRGLLTTTATAGLLLCHTLDVGHDVVVDKARHNT